MTSSWNVPFWNYARTFCSHSRKFRVWKFTDAVALSMSFRFFFGCIWSKSLSTDNLCPCANRRPVWWQIFFRDICMVTGHIKRWMVPRRKLHLYRKSLCIVVVFLQSSHNNYPNIAVHHVINELGWTGLLAINFVVDEWKYKMILSNICWKRSTTRWLPFRSSFDIIRTSQC